jgi:hypothetical protein
MGSCMLPYIAPFEKRKEKKKLFSLTSSQIWLSPPVNDHQSTYLKKLKKNSNKNK